MAKRQIETGADVIDIGAESARTNRAAISVSEEIRRFSGFLERWEEMWRSAKPRDEEQIWPPVLSANTWRSAVIEEILKTGQIELINDMSALPDGENARLCAAAGVSLLIMHSVGEPKIPQLHRQWEDVMGSMERFFEEKIALAEAAGLSRDALVLDPGIDFAKQRDDNLTVFRELDRLGKLGRPILVPVSRKTVIGEVLDLPEPVSRDAGTVACLSSAMMRGASIFRVHNVAAAWESVKIMNRLLLG